MIAVNYNIEQTDATKTPATHTSWRFGGLSAAELLPILQRHLSTQDDRLDTLSNWQLVWLNNNDNLVIGLLPKVSWQIYASRPSHQNNTEKERTYNVITHYRDTKNSQQATTSEFISYKAWQQQLITYSQSQHNSRAINIKNSEDSQSSVPRYTQGLIGFIGYDIAAFELSPASNLELAAQPHAVLGHYDIYLSQVDSSTHEDTIDNDKSWILNIVDSCDSNDNDTLSDDKKKHLIASLAALDLQLSKNTAISYSPKPLILIPLWQKSHYQQAFERTQNYLKQGDCYQVNLTQTWQGTLNSSNNAQKFTPKLIDYLPALQRNTRAPFAGYVAVDNLGNFDDSDTNHHGSDAQSSVQNNSSFELLSCSPELFLTFTYNQQTCRHHIRTKPIKGTMPRGSTIEQDALFKQQLIDSDKDRSENVMIVDLLRNDLGKYAKTGSVKVPQLFEIESFSNVHHMVSTITAELKPSTHSLAVLFGSLPAGSITGTPKKRAVEIISELEVAARGAYCGTMGYMNFDGSGQWNVLIRTLQANNDTQGKKQVNLWAGGGITIASDCASEYQECLDKVGNLLAVLADEHTASKL